MKLIDQYPTMAKFKYRLWLHTNLHPFGFFAGETKPSIDIRISDSSLFRGVSMEDRVQMLAMLCAWTLGTIALFSIALMLWH